MRIFQISKAWRRYRALSTAFSFWEEGATQLVPPQGSIPEGLWFIPVARLTERLPMSGPRVSRSVYSPAYEFQPSKQREVVRELIWQEETDRARAREQPVDALDLTIRYFEVGEDASSELDSALQGLEATLSNLSPETPGLALTHRDYEPDVAVQRELPNGPKVRVFEWKRISESERVSFREGLRSEVDLWWDRTWSALTAVCQPALEVQGYESNYMLPPDLLTALLTNAVEEL